MLYNLKKSQAGFTIIEVLIVLAIAGLIMVIVFLAVPALQRNSRNTQYRNEASQILAATSEWSNNSSGNIPTSTDNNAIMALTKTKNITSLTVQAESGTIVPTLSAAVLRTGAKCNASQDTDPGSTRQIAILFSIEDAAGNPVKQCLDS